MSEEKITGLEFLKNIPKTNDLVSAYGSVNLEQLNNVIKRLKKIPNYDELLKDNNNLQQENKQLKEDKKKAIEYIKDNYRFIDLNTGEKSYTKGGKDLLEILGDKENE